MLDNPLVNAAVSFTEPFPVGLLITLVSCLCYVVTWQIYFFNWGQDFTRQYTEHSLAKLKANGTIEKILDKWGLKAQG